MGLDGRVAEVEPVADLGLERPRAIKRRTSNSRSVSSLSSLGGCSGARGYSLGVGCGPRRSGSISDMTTLVVLDHGEPIAISFDDLLKYHGRSSIAGVAHAFKAMERAFPLLSPGEPPERNDITVESGFPGGGARDAFEMVTRAVTGDRYRLASKPAGIEAPEAPGGHFFFRLGYPGTVVELVARAYLIPDEFIEVACREAPTAAEAARAQQLKEEMANRLLGLPAEAVYDATLH